MFTKDQWYKFEGLKLKPQLFLVKVRAIFRLVSLVFTIHQITAVNSVQHCSGELKQRHLAPQIPEAPLHRGPFSLAPPYWEAPWAPSL